MLPAQHEMGLAAALSPYAGYAHHPSGHQVRVIERLGVPRWYMWFPCSNEQTLRRRGLAGVWLPSVGSACAQPGCWGMALCTESDMCSWSQVHMMPQPPPMPHAAHAATVQGYPAMAVAHAQVHHSYPSGYTAQYGHSPGPPPGDPAMRAHGAYMAQPPPGFEPLYARPARDPYAWRGAPVPHPPGPAAFVGDRGGRRGESDSDVSGGPPRRRRSDVPQGAAPRFLQLAGAVRRGAASCASARTHDPRHSMCHVLRKELEQTAQLPAAVRGEHSATMLLQAC